MTNQSFAAATSMDLANTAVPPQRLPGANTSAYSKRLTPTSGRAIECLAHGIEYIQDTTFHHHPDSPEALAAADAISLLTALNRAVFADLPSAAPRRSLLRTIVRGWDRNRLEGRNSA